MDAMGFGSLPPATDAVLTWLFLPAHFSLAWTCAGINLMAGAR